LSLLVYFEREHEDEIREMIQVLEFFDFVYLGQGVVEEFVSGHHGTGGCLDLTFGSSDFEFSLHFQYVKLFLDLLDHVTFSTTLEHLLLYE